MIYFSVRRFAAVLLLGFVACGCNRASYVFRADNNGWRGVPAAVFGPPPAAQAETARRAARTPSPAWSKHRARLPAWRRTPQSIARRTRAVEAGPAAQPVVGRPLLPARVRAQRLPTPEVPEPVRLRSRGVAVLLAVLLGMFGAHWFYLGYRDRALAYLLATLVGVGVGFAAIPVAQTVGGNPFGGVLVGLTLLLLGATLVLGVYLCSLVDAVRIITNDIKPRDGAFYPRFLQTKPVGKPRTLSLK